MYLIEVKKLAALCNYTQDYLVKILRKHNISNRILLDENDILILNDNIEVVTNKSYMLFIETKKILIENNLYKAKKAL